MAVARYRMICLVLRTGSGTVDAIFALHGLIEKYISSGKKLYCCFIDYKEAFDCIDRKLLFYKLAKLGIRGKLFDTVFSLYSHVKRCVKYNSELSDFFDVERGVLQGEALSPMLFSMYLNDFENSFLNSNCSAVELKELSLFLIMYADDTVLLAESPNDL